MGIPCYGLIPVRLGPPDFAMIHGVNERVAVMDLKEGTRFLYDLIAALCCLQSKACMKHTKCA
jgi:acetylornithine deacetylase/succinyl-diaminopimelate desuccinylase-like protein